MNKDIERQINKLYNDVFRKIYTQKNFAKLARGSKVEITTTARLLEASAAYDKFAKKFAIELAKKSLSKKRLAWKKQYLAARRVHYIALPKTYNEYEMNVLSNAIKHNFLMIKTIPRRTLEILEHKYTSTLIEEVMKGAIARGSFKRELEKHGHKNAGVIARTETAKLQTAITEQRATSLGSVAYIWRSSNDKRTRKSHRDMNNVIVFWRLQTQKPVLDNMQGNAGEFPNCRCDTMSIVDIDDLKKATYKVYDYRIGKIITMNRHDVIAAIKRGSLD